MEKFPKSQWILHLSSRKLTLCVSFCALAALPIQLLMGASPWIVLLAVIIIALGLFCFRIFGAYNLGAWLILFYVLGNVLFALFAKTLMRQPLDSHLYVPLDSFLVLAITTGALFVALIIAGQMKLGRPWLRPIRNPKMLAWLSWGCFLLGVLFWFLNQHFQGPDGTGFGGLAVFRDLILMGIIARTALLLIRGDRILVMDIGLVFILVAAVFLGLLSNSKMYAAYPVVSYFVTILFYRRGLPWRHIALLTIGGVLFVVILVPMIQAWRYLGEQEMTVKQRVILLARAPELIFTDHGLKHIDRLSSIQFRGGYYNYFGGDGRAQTLLGRYASVQQIDPVIYQINKRGEIGGSVIWPAFTRLLPKFLYPNKPKYIESYKIVVDLGLINPAGGKYPTVPLAGQAYAGYGWLGVLTIPFVVFLGFLLAIKKLGWDLYRNVFAIFFFCEFVIVYASQGTLGQYAGAVLRSFPLFLLVFWALIAIHHFWRDTRVLKQSSISAIPR